MSYWSRITRTAIWLNDFFNTSILLFAVSKTKDVSLLCLLDGHKCQNKHQQLLKKIPKLPQKTQTKEGAPLFVRSFIQKTIIFPVFSEESPERPLLDRGQFIFPSLKMFPMCCRRSLVLQFEVLDALTKQGSITECMNVFILSKCFKTIFNSSR